MKRKQTYFLVAAPTTFGSSPIFVAYGRVSEPDAYDWSRDSAGTDEEKHETNWIRSALGRAVNGVNHALRIPRIGQRLSRFRSGI